MKNYSIDLSWTSQGAGVSELYTVVEVKVTPELEQQPGFAWIPVTVRTSKHTRLLWWNRGIYNCGRFFPNHDYTRLRLGGAGLLTKINKRLKGSEEVSRVLEAAEKKLKAQISLAPVGDHWFGNTPAGEHVFSFTERQKNSAWRKVTPGNEEVIWDVYLHHKNLTLVVNSETPVPATTLPVHHFILGAAGNKTFRGGQGYMTAKTKRKRLYALLNKALDTWALKRDDAAKHNHEDQVDTQDQEDKDWAEIMNHEKEQQEAKTGRAAPEQVQRELPLGDPAQLRPLKILGWRPVGNGNKVVLTAEEVGGKYEVEVFSSDNPSYKVTYDQGHLDETEEGSLARLVKEQGAGILIHLVRELAKLDK